MRKLQPRPKERLHATIPADLRASLREVADLIATARREGTDLSYDDAIQAGPVCGGHYGPEGRPYALRYTPPDDPDRGAWQLHLARCQIVDIAGGFLTELHLHACTSPDCRRKFTEPDAHCPDCDYIRDPDYAHLSLADARPRLDARGLGLPPEAHRSDVLTMLGPPDEAGGGQTHGLGYLRPWVKYVRPEGQVRFEFGRDGAVAAVTFLPRDWTPGA